MLKESLAFSLGLVSVALVLGIEPLSGLSGNSESRTSGGQGGPPLGT